MSIPCEVITAEELLEEIRKEFNFPFNYLSGLIYHLDSCYGQLVTIKCLSKTGYVCESVFLIYKDGRSVSFGQFKMFLERFVVLPNYSKLCLKVGSKGVVVAEVSTFPMKVRG